MTVFVSLGDPAAELASILNKTPVKDGSASQLLTSECIDGLLTGDVNTAKTTFSIAFSTMSSMNVQDIAKLSERITSSATKSTDDGTEIRLWVQVTLFNSVQVDSIKSRILLSLLKYALDASLGSSLEPSLSCIDQWLNDWMLDEPTKARLLSLIADLYDADQKPDLAQERRLRILSLQTDDKALHDLQSQTVVKSIIYVFKYAKISTLDRLLATITARNMTKTPLIDLLLIMSSGSSADLDAFCDQHGDVLTQQAIDSGRLLAYHRALQLCELAAGRKTLSLNEDVKEAFSLASLDDAEQVFIDAAMFGLVSGQIDENEGRIYITSCMYRTLNDDVWKDLQRRLQTWRDSVGAVLPWNQHVPS